jgi:hypothetical protein
VLECLLSKSKALSSNPNATFLKMSYIWISYIILNNKLFKIYQLRTQSFIISQSVVRPLAQLSQGPLVDETAVRKSGMVSGISSREEKIHLQARLHSCWQASGSGPYASLNLLKTAQLASSRAKGEGEEGIKTETNRGKSQFIIPSTKCHPSLLPHCL